MTLTADQRIKYVRAVWDTFCSQNKIHRECSNVEYEMARKWATRHVSIGQLGAHQIIPVPLATILQGIVETAGKPRTLLACERAVEENISRWAQAMGGATELPAAGPLEPPEELPL